MAATTTPDRARTSDARRDTPGRRLVTETKSALKTTEFAAFVKSETVKWADVVKKSGAKLD